jgi:hypothetical protein
MTLRVELLRLKAGGNLHLSIKSKHGWTSVCSFIRLHFKLFTVVPGEFKEDV